MYLCVCVHVHMRACMYVCAPQATRAGGCASGASGRHGARSAFRWVCMCICARASMWTVAGVVVVHSAQTALFGCRQHGTFCLMILVRLCVLMCAYFLMCACVRASVCACPCTRECVPCHVACPTPWVPFICCHAPRKCPVVELGIRIELWQSLTPLPATPLRLLRKSQLWLAHREHKVQALATTPWGELWTGSTYGTIRVWASNPQAGNSE